MRGRRTAAFALVLAAGCSAQRNQQDLREAWVRKLAGEGSVDAQRLALSGISESGVSEVDYFEGWYPVEFDADRAWRWMGKRALVRLKLGDSPAGAVPAARGGHALSISGWLPHEHLGNAARELQFELNGHRLSRFEAPADRFAFTLAVPEVLLGAGGWVELAVVATNTVKPTGDERELGFATSGVSWARVTPTDSP